MSIHFLRAFCLVLHHVSACEPSMPHRTRGTADPERRSLPTSFLLLLSSFISHVACHAQLQDSHTLHDQGPEFFASLNNTYSRAQTRRDKPRTLRSSTNACQRPVATVTQHTSVRQLPSRSHRIPCLVLSHPIILRRVRMRSTVSNISARMYVPTTRLGTPHQPLDPWARSWQIIIILVYETYRRDHHMYVQREGGAIHR